MRADHWHGATLTLAIAVTLGVPADQALAEAPDHAKGIKQCNDELRANAAALTKAGESPAAFFHDCWWRTAAGRPTRLRGSEAGGTSAASAPAAQSRAQTDADLTKAKQEAAAAKREAAAAVEAAKAAQARAAKAEAKAKAAASAPAGPRAKAEPAAAKAVAAVRPRHVARAQRVSMAPRRTVATRPFVVPPAERRRLFAVAARPSPAAAPAPLVVMVPVQIPGLGLRRPIPWPVFPAYVPAFRNVVNNPIVPGFTKTP